MRKLLLAVALGGALTAHAADPKFDAFMGTVVGNNTTVTFGGNGQPVATNSNHLGTAPVATVGNMGVAAPGGQPAYVGRAEVPVAGTNKRVPVDVKVPIKKVSIARALIAAAKYGAGGAGGIAVGYAAEALLDFGLSNVRVQDGKLVADKPSDSAWPSNGQQYHVWNTQGWKAYGPTPKAACDSFGALAPSIFAGPNYFQSYRFDGRCIVSAKGPGGTSDWTYDIASISFCPAGYYFTAGGGCSAVAPSDPVDQAMIEQMITGSDGWPSSATVALAQMSADPRLEPLLETEKPNIVGPFKIQETPTVRTFSEPKPGAPGQTQTVTQTTQKTVGLDYTDNKVKSTVTETKQRVVDGVAEPEETTQKDPENDFLVCGLPNTPACRIEEKGTPEPVEDTAQKDAEKVHKPLDDFLKDPKSMLPSFPTINWTFRLPSGCAPLTIPAFAPFLQEIDVCQFQPMFHDIMSMIWVGGALFGAIGTFWRNVFAKAG